MDDLEQRVAAWKKYEADFNAMTDAEIARETEACRAQVEEAEDWLEAVAAWEEAGKPRAAIRAIGAP